MNLQKASLRRIQRCSSSLTKIGSAHALRICPRSGPPADFLLPAIFYAPCERGDRAMHALVEKTSYVSDVVEDKPLFIVEEGALERRNKGIEPRTDGENVPSKSAQAVARKTQLGDQRPVRRQRAQLGQRREARAPGSVQRRADRDQPHQCG